MNQKEVWENIAQPWKEFKINPDAEVVDFLKDKKGKILDLGCGSGRNFVKLNTEYKVYGVDFSKEMLKYAKQFAKKKKTNIEIVNANVNCLPFDNNFFDSAIFIRALHCVDSKKEREKALRELFRVMKPNAEALISVWDKNQERFKNSEKEKIISWSYKGKKNLRYYYLYEKKEFKELLKKIGFKVIKIHDRKNKEGLNSEKNIIVKVRK
tara:strand:+ start:448 stop:1077 length:630 start_codon:yes stop_codon:yes gene_type:complete